ncbi:hypothetical protein HDU79_007021 [Rhizoclosmatium sp. JEL0117]|nr:hypothetical protein HDU79_007021 [Rhizoclosmatium sp. JEL0117]
MMANDAPAPSDSTTDIQVKGKAVADATEIPASAESTENAEYAHLSTNELIALGKKYSATGDFEKAVEVLGCASAKLADVHGADSPLCADVLFLYGAALFENAVAKLSPLGGSVDAANEDAAADATDAAKESGRFVFEGDADDLNEGASSSSAAPAEPVADADNSNQEEEQDGEGGDAEDEEEGSDMQLAWETLDLARLGYQKMGPEGELKMADVLLALGDVSLEQAQWAQAIEDFTAAITIKSNRLSADDRELAEANYKLSLAHEFAEDFDKALECQETVMSVLNKKLASLKDLQGEQLTDRVIQETEDIEGLLADIKSKIIDLNLQKSEAAKKAAAAAEESNASSTLASTSTTTAPAVVNDISGLVKSKKNVSNSTSPSKDATSGLKRKADECEEPAGEEGAKKVKEGSDDN